MTSEKHNGKVYTFKKLWLQEQYKKLRACTALKDYSDRELQEYLLKQYEKRRLVEGRLYNNSTADNMILTQEQFINEYLNKPYILSGYATFYKTQDEGLNITSAALENLGDMRKVNKKKMEAAVHGSNEYIYYRIIQLTYKLLMNSYYGILGEKNSVFYNPFVQNSITLTGQDLITTAIEGLEAFLSNNVKFEDTDDVITFINNVVSDEKKFSILDYIDEPISRSELLEYFMSHGKPDVKLDESIIKLYIDGLNIEETTYCYYKNNIYKILSQSWFKNELSEILKYEYAGELAPEIKDRFEHFKEVIIDCTYYDHLFEDRYKRAMKDTRHTIITIDTDSVFVNGNKYVKKITEMFNLNPENESEQGTIINLIINIVSEVLRLLMLTITTNMGLLDRAKPIMNLKQEFLYKRILLTRNKKNYAGIITAELGHLLDKPSTDIKGMPALKKTSMPRALRASFKRIVEDEILNTKTISVKKVIDEYDQLEEEIEKSIRNGEIDYLLPKNIEVIESYKAPDTIEAVRAVLIWNALEPEEVIVPPEKINMIQLNCTDPNDPRLLKMKEDYPDKYNIIMKTVFNYGVNPEDVKVDISRFGFSCIALPKGIERIPDYIRPFIDYRGMVNYNMSPGFVILESLGIQCEEVKTVKYKSNIIKL